MMDILNIVGAWATVIAIAYSVGFMLYAVGRQVYRYSSATGGEYSAVQMLQDFGSFLLRLNPMKYLIAITCGAVVFMVGLVVTQSVFTAVGGAVVVTSVLVLIRSLLVRAKRARQVASDPADATVPVSSD